VVRLSDRGLHRDRLVERFMDTPRSGHTPGRCGDWIHGYCPKYCNCERIPGLAARAGNKPP
jgi:hypothetical protein